MAATQGLLHVVTFVLRKESFAECSLCNGKQTKLPPEESKRFPTEILL